MAVLDENQLYCINVSVVRQPHSRSVSSAHCCDWGKVAEMPKVGKVGKICLCCVKLKFHWDQFPRNFPVANVTGKLPACYEEAGDFQTISTCPDGLATSPTSLRGSYGETGPSGIRAITIFLLFFPNKSKKNIHPVIFFATV